MCARRPPEVPLPGVEFTAVDLRDRTAVHDFVGGLPRLDVLVNNVGGSPYRPLAGMGAAETVMWSGMPVSSS